MATEMKTITFPGSTQPYSFVDETARSEAAAKQPKGDYALKSEIPVVPVYELIESITLEEETTEILRTGLSLKCVELYIHAAVAAAANNAGVTFTNGSGTCGYAWLTSMINTTDRYAFVRAVSDGENAAYSENTYPTTTAVTNATMLRSPARLDGSTPINSISIYASASGNAFPAGSMIEIWGVKADA